MNYRREIVHDNPEKYDHFVTLQDGTEVQMDYNPYRSPSPQIIDLWVEAGCPPRQGIGPLEDYQILKFLKFRINDIEIVPIVTGQHPDFFDTWEEAHEHLLKKIRNEYHTAKERLLIVENMTYD